MAKEKIQLGGESNDALMAGLSKLQAEYSQTRFDHTVNGLANPGVLGDMRKDIARYNTEMRKRELAAMTPEELAMRSKTRARRRR